MKNENKVLGFDGKFRILDDAQYEEYKKLKEQYEYWDRKQAVRKVFLNSLYGALLNRFFRFSDPRMGQSTTLSGRVVAKHLARKVNEILLGKYEFGKAIIAGDTDSVMFTMESVLGKDATVDDAVELADAVAAAANESVVDAMCAHFFVKPERVRISAERELVAVRGLFKDKKKRYAMAIVDKGGTRESSMKIMGMDSKRTELPAEVRKFLKDCIVAVVRDGHGKDVLAPMVESFLAKYRQMDPWTIGKLVGVSDVEEGSRLRKLFEAGRIPNPRIHFGVIAADNTNRYMDFYEDKTMDYVRSGDKVIVLDLLNDPKRNPLQVQTVALPLGVQKVPDWFKALPFDVNEMEKKHVLHKLDVTFGESMASDFKPREFEDAFG